MKNLIRNLLLIITLLGYKNNYAQTCGGTSAPLPCWYTPNWDWLDVSANNWEAQIGSAVVPMGCPFTSPTSSSDMISITSALDYRPEQGWTLFAKNFGCIGGLAAANAMPYFMLYNKYKGVIRVFIFVGSSSQLNRGSLILKWNTQQDNNSLLTTANQYLKANDNYSLTSNLEKHVNYLNQVPSSGGSAWVVTEYLVQFDPNTLNNVANFQYIDFDVHLSQGSLMTLSGDINISTESGTPKDPPTATNSSTPGITNYITQAKDFLGKVPKANDLQSSFSSIVAGTDTINNLFQAPFTRDLKKFTNDMNSGSVKKFMIGTATVADKILANGYLEIAAQMLNMFVGKSNTVVASSASSFIQPTISKGTVKLTGTIETSANPLTISLQLPGTSHKYSNGTINCPDLPVYDCPLGVVSLQRAPQIEKKSHSMYAGLRLWQTDTFIINQTPQFQSIQHGMQIKEKYYSYRVNSDLELALNGAAGVSIDNIKAALFVVQDESIQPPDTTFEIIKNRTGSNGTGSTGYNELTSPPNPVNLTPNSMYYARQLREGSYISSGIFKLSTSDQSLKKIEYCTQFVDIANFRNTVIIAQPAMRVLLKLLITMSPTDPYADQSPIIFVQTYDLSNMISTAGSTDPVQNGAPPPFTCNQQQQLLSPTTSLTGPQTVNSGLYAGVYVKTNNAITVDANSTSTSYVKFKGGNRVKMSPGFSAKASGSNYFRAYIDNSGICSAGSNALVLPSAYFDNCNSNATSNRAAHYSGSDTAKAYPGNSSINSGLNKVGENEIPEMTVIPNPNAGEFSLSFINNVGTGSIKIMDNLGREVFTENLEDGKKEYKITTSLDRGCYYLLWNSSKFVISRKLIVE